MTIKTICFLMPGPIGGGPVGGYKVVYEYASRLSSDGYDVTIIYPLTSNFKDSPFTQIKRLFHYSLYWIIKGVTGRKWFPLNSQITEKVVFSLNWRRVPKTEIYFATAVATSYYLSKYPIPNKSKYYLIQGYEDWGHTKKYVNNSYILGLTNITISQWLYDKVEQTGAKSVLIKNGFDFEYFKLTNFIKDRNPLISMLYHSNKNKGCKYGLEALSIVKNKYPQLKAILFGVPKRPDDLPEWIEYYQRPNKEKHNDIYNKSYIYLAPSLQEGWGLTVGEAMICGAAIVCTDTLGFHEMVVDNHNGLIVPTSNAQALAEAMTYLIDNKDIHDRLACQGNTDIQSFTWENSYKLLKDLIDSNTIIK